MLFLDFFKISRDIYARICRHVYKYDDVCIISFKDYLKASTKRWACKFTWVLLYISQNSNSRFKVYVSPAGNQRRCKPSMELCNGFRKSGEMMNVWHYFPINPCIINGSPTNLSVARYIVDAPLGHVSLKELVLFLYLLIASGKCQRGKIVAKYDKRCFLIFKWEIIR